MGYCRSRVLRQNRTNIGLLLNYRRMGTPETQFGALTADLYGGIDAGELHAELELAANYGGGDLEGGFDNLNLFSFGAATKLGLKIDKLAIELGGGFAQGDSTPNDPSISRIQFNRDYNLALMMFEEPMPTLQSAYTTEENQGRDESAIRTGYALENAIYVRPNIGYTFPKTLSGSLVFLTAWTAALPEEEEGNNFYGFEVDAHLKWNPLPNFTLESSLGFFQPGSYYGSYTEQGGGFDRYALGAQLLSTIDFNLSQKGSDMSQLTGVFTTGYPLQR